MIWVYCWLEFVCVMMMLFCGYFLEGFGLLCRDEFLFRVFLT